RGDPLDAERDGRARRDAKRRTGACERKELRRAYGVRLPLSPRPRKIPRQATFDHERPRGAGRPVPARLSRSKQLSAQRAWYRPLLSQRPWIDRIWQDVRQPRQWAI